MRRSAATLATLCLLLIPLWAPAAAEWNPLSARPVSIGPQTHRLIVGFRATPDNAVERVVRSRAHPQGFHYVQARTSAADVAALLQRTGIAVATSRQVTPSLHVLFLPRELYGAEVEATLAQLRADPAVKFADVDQRRYALSVTPNDPLFLATPNAVPPASGQWYLLPANTGIVVEGQSTMDLSATDAVDAWGISTGSTSLVIADVDTGILFNHPDLLRANQGGRLLPGYDFVGDDLNPNTSASLGTYLIANDGDGWDPDPSDPGDWINSGDIADPSGLFSKDTAAPSSWHGTRVVGIFGAIANNNTGIAGLAWGPWVLPVRALGKGGGYDSDIVAGIEWAAGMSVTPPDAATSSTTSVPDNPFPADIINLSIGGGASTCDAVYQSELPTITQMGVLVVIAAGNANATVASPGICSLTVPGVITVAGLRNVGTKVGYSSFGPAVGVSAPAGNCINTTAGSDCLRSIDTTTNDGATSPDPSGNGYTNEQNPNLGTSFATPIVSGIAALMRSVNANLTPALLVTRLEASATAFPANSANLPVCPMTDETSGECSCVAVVGTPNQCGAGMVNALSAVQAAQKPIGVISYPASLANGSVLDASGSVAACNTSASPPVPLGIKSYAWVSSTQGLITGSANAAQVTVNPGGGGSLTLTVTDTAGNVDTETVVLSATSVVSSSAPTSAGPQSMACPAALAVNPAAPTPPTVSASFSPATVAPNSESALTITFDNANAYVLTEANFSANLPAGLSVPTGSSASTTCVGSANSAVAGAALALTNTADAVNLSNAYIPANGSCSITLSVQAATTGSYALSVGSNALSTGPGGGNAAAATAALTVANPSSGGGSGGGGAVGWLDVLTALAAVVAIARRAGRMASGEY